MERHQDEQRTATLPESESRLRCLLEYAHEGYVLYDEAGCVRDVNRSACDVYGYSEDEMRGRSIAELVDGGTDPSVLTAVDDELCGGRPRVLEVEARTKGGESFPAELRVVLLDSEAGRFFVGLIRDVSESKLAEQRIEYLSGHDGLTGLPNCHLFGEHLEAAVERAERHQRELAVLHVDINRFRLINQGLGPGGGDELLRQTASRLREAARPMDVVARYSADEFLMLVADVESDAAATARSVADAVHQSLERPFQVNGTEIYADASVGMSVFPLDADEASVLLRHADAASQQAKRPGEGPTKRFAGETSDKWARLWLATRLRKAVARDQLVLHYQPIIDLGSAARARREGRLGSSVVAAEALVRWRDRGDLVPPLTFIPLAEDMGLIDGIGNWVVKEACRQALEWRAAGSPIDITLNLSLHELWQPELVERLRREVGASGLEPRSITLEITETSAMTDPVRCGRILHQLREHGFKLAMDDFGAGHSSLSRLSELPCEVLKIDRSFVERLPEDPSATAMVAAMIELARGLGMRAVAEGIETEEQLGFLVDRGCPYGQGFLFSRPVAGSEIPAL